jgi:hypothetical protein
MKDINIPNRYKDIINWFFKKKLSIFIYFIIICYITKNNLDIYKFQTLNFFNGSSP